MGLRSPMLSHHMWYHFICSNFGPSLTAAHGKRWQVPQCQVVHRRAWQVMSARLGGHGGTEWKQQKGSAAGWHVASPTVHSGYGTGAQERQRCLVGTHFLAEITKAVSDRCRMVPDWASLGVRVSDSLVEDLARGCGMAGRGLDKGQRKGLLSLWHIDAHSIGEAGHA